MANEQNLTHRLTVSEQRAGGRASGEARRKKKQLRDALQELLDREYTDREGHVADGTAILAAQLFKKAQNGDIRAWEVLRDTVGQKPVEKIEVDTIDPEARERVERILSED